MSVRWTFPSLGENIQVLMEISIKSLKGKCGSNPIVPEKKF